jgi:hypothetical protein
VLDVQPVADERLAGGALRLRDLVLVVREDEVFATGMDVEGGTQCSHAHGGALDVPAGPALPQGVCHAAPTLRSTSFAPLPQREIAGIGLLVLVRIDAARPRGEAGTRADGPGSMRDSRP